MKAVIQRVSQAHVSVEGKVIGEIQNGLLVLLGVSVEDEEKDAEWLAKKICHLRIFADEDGKMNKSLLDVSGELLVISQFTLLADAKQGNRPSYIQAARPEKAIPLYEKFISFAESWLKQSVQTGKFGADMQVSLLNDGPVTLMLDSREM